MKKIITILLLFTYIFTTTQLGQLFKLPLLVHHYKIHKEENKNLSFLSFLKMHYASDNIVDDDYEDDMKLPFKTIIDNSSFCTVATLPIKEFTLTDVIHFNSIEKKKISTQSNKLIPSFTAKIWQPPKFYLS